MIFYIHSLSLKIKLVSVVVTFNELYIYNLLYNLNKIYINNNKFTCYIR